jgi:hypothetical protein
MEEHKMEQDAADASNTSTSSSSSSQSQSEYFCFHPNRFDAGYGKYMDPLQQAQQQQPPNHNFMDVS